MGGLGEGPPPARERPPGRGGGFFRSQAERALEALRRKAPDDVEKAWFDGLIDPVEEQKRFLEAVLPELEKVWADFGERAARKEKVEFDPFEPAARKWIEEHAFELVKQVTETTVKRLRETLREGWELGEGIEDLARRIRDVFDQATRYRSFVIARTETTAAANIAQIAVMERAGYGYKTWWAAQDERMCPLCRALHGKTVRIDREFAPGVFAPPRHCNCRCTTLAASEPNVGGFDSLDDAIEWAREAYPHITWDFEGASIDTINPTLEEFHKLARIHPEAAKRLKFVSTKYSWERFEQQPYAVFQPAEDARGIYLNPSFYGNKKRFVEQLKDDEASGWHPRGSGKIEYVLAHEFGHLIDEWLTIGGENAAVLPAVSARDGVGLVSSTLREFKQQWYARSEEVEKLSRYALKQGDNREMFAEAFSSLYVGEGGGEIVRHLKVLLEELAPEKWTTNWKWVHLIESEEGRRAAMTALDKLRRRLGLK